uniref:Regulatory protein SIR2 homolog 7 n=1 Tax=Timema douglasi TaxID=61478 RepID=A0A7R8VSL1_TIMDO|nr:unnamed protein product [Timema douglasi]
MAAESEVKSGVSRRKSSQSITFCIKQERNALFKKVSTILQKPEIERTDEEKEVLRSSNMLLMNSIPMASTFLVSLTFTVHVSAVYVTMGTKYTLYNTSLHSKDTSLLHSRIQKRQRVKDRLQEVEDPPDVLAEKCRGLAAALAGSRHLVVYTGAGISTAACIPDYRGTNGIWTLLQQGKDIGCIKMLRKKQTYPFCRHSMHDLSRAEPTLTHMALAELHRASILKHVVSQNCDGLHLRSVDKKTTFGAQVKSFWPQVCRRCRPPREYLRMFDVTENTARFNHRTMRRCYTCMGPLVDTIVHFGERGTLQWPLNWPGACKMADNADIILCVGSSLKVLKKYPWLWCMDKPVKKRPKLFIINLQWTPKDEQATLKINGKCDEVMTQVMQYLRLNIPKYDRSDDPMFGHVTMLHPAEEHTTKQPSLQQPSSSPGSPTKTRLVDGETSSESRGKDSKRKLNHETSDPEPVEKDDCVAEVEGKPPFGGAPIQDCGAERDAGGFILQQIYQKNVNADEEPILIEIIDCKSEEVMKTLMSEDGEKMECEKIHDGFVPMMSEGDFKLTVAVKNEVSVIDIEMNGVNPNNEEVKLCEDSLDLGQNSFHFVSVEVDEEMSETLSVNPLMDENVDDPFGATDESNEIKPDIFKDIPLFHKRSSPEVLASFKNDGLVSAVNQTNFHIENIINIKPVLNQQSDFSIASILGNKLGCLESEVKTEEKFICCPNAIVGKCQWGISDCLSKRRNVNNKSFEDRGTPLNNLRFWNPYLLPSFFPQQPESVFQTEHVFNGGRDSSRMRTKTLYEGEPLYLGVNNGATSSLTSLYSSIDGDTRQSTNYNFAFPHKSTNHHEFSSFSIERKKQSNSNGNCDYKLPTTVLCSFCKPHYGSNVCLFYAPRRPDFKILTHGSNPDAAICECCDRGSEDEEEEENEDDTEADVKLKPKNVKEESVDDTGEGADGEGADGESPAVSKPTLNKVPMTNPGWFGKGYRKRTKKKKLESR